jgi:hypothetical protein
VCAPHLLQKVPTLLPRQEHPRARLPRHTHTDKTPRVIQEPHKHVIAAPSRRGRPGASQLLLHHLTSTMYDVLLILPHNPSYTMSQARHTSPPKNVTAHPHLADACEDGLDVLEEADVEDGQVQPHVAEVARAVRKLPPEHHNTTPLSAQGLTIVISAHGNQWHGSMRLGTERPPECSS